MSRVKDFRQYHEILIHFDEHSSETRDGLKSALSGSWDRHVFAKSRRAGSAPSRLHLNDRSLTVLGLLVVAAMLVGGSIVLLQARRDAWTTAKEASQNLRLALDRDIARNLKVFDLSLQGVIRALATPGIADASAEVRRLALFNSAVTAEDLGALRVLDAEGRILEDSTSPARTVTISVLGRRSTPESEATGRRPRRQPDGRDMTADSDLTLSLTRRIPMPDGRIVEGRVAARPFPRPLRKPEPRPSRNHHCVPGRRARSLRPSASGRHHRS